MTQSNNNTALELTQAQTSNARRFIKKLTTQIITSEQADERPDTGGLSPVIDILSDNYKDGGNKAVLQGIKSLTLEYPMLTELLQSSSKYTPLKISELLTMPEQAWLITNFLYEDSISVVYGPPGSGKSFLVLDWMSHVALGLDWQGRTVKRCRVIYLAAEGVRGYQRRVQAWCHHFGILPCELEKYLLFVPCAVPLNNAEEVSSFIEAIKDCLEDYDDGMPSMIVLDTLFQCAAGMNINATDVMSGLCTTAQIIKTETKAIHMLIVHHSGKDDSKGMSGNMALKASTDMSYKVTQDLDGIITLASDKVKDDEDITTYMQRVKVTYGDGMRDNSCVVIATDRPVTQPKLSFNQQTILEVLPDTFPGLCFAEVQKSIAENAAKAIAKQTLFDNLKKLIDAKLVIHEGQRYYKKRETLDDDTE